jgi:hypothetical protein
LRRAKLRWSEFRGFDLDQILFPEGGDHMMHPRTIARIDQLENADWFSQSV